MYEWYMGNVRMVQGKCTNSTWAMYQIEMAFLHHLTTLPTIVTTLSTAHSIISVYHKNAILLLLTFLLIKQGENCPKKRHLTVLKVLVNCFYRNP